MARRQINNLKWVAKLCKLGEAINPDTDRVEMGYPIVRDIRYNNIGITSQDKYFSKQDGQEIVKKVEVRIDRDIEENQKDYRIEIKGRMYNISRIYVREADRVMEVSLSYAD